MAIEWALAIGIAMNDPHELEIARYQTREECQAAQGKLLALALRVWEEDPNAVIHLNGRCIPVAPQKQKS